MSSLLASNDVLLRLSRMRARSTALLLVTRLFSARSSCSCLNRGKEPEEEEELLGMNMMMTLCCVRGKRETRQMKRLYMRRKQGALKR